MSEVPLYQAAYKFDEFNPTLLPEEVAARKVKTTSPFVFAYYLANKTMPTLLGPPSDPRHMPTVGS